MKRVTFFIGNGFDINLGLKTQYKDFYQYYWFHSPNHKLADDIQADYKNWADLELGLGQYTSKIIPEEVDSFLIEEDYLEQTLAEYLDEECKKIKLDDSTLKEKIALQMQDFLQNFHRGLNIEQKQHINKRIRETRETIEYTFINFNYTNTLERILEVTREVVSNTIGTHQADNGTSFLTSIGLHLHIHGTTTEEMIVGVNDESQIVNKELCQNVFFKELLLKPEANKRYGQNKIVTAERLIDESLFVCVFGMSLGETDKMWWEYLCKWLVINPARRLIIYVRKGDVFRRTKMMLFSSENEVFEKMKTYADGVGDIWDQIRNQIYIEFNSNIFTFEKMI